MGVSKGFLLKDFRQSKHACAIKKSGPFILGIKPAFNLETSDNLGLSPEDFRISIRRAFSSLVTTQLLRIKNTINRMPISVKSVSLARFEG